MEEANLNPSSPPKWTQVYDFNSFYNVKNPYDYSGILKEIEKINDKDNSQYHKLSSIYFTGGPLYEKYVNSKKVKRSLYCKMMTDNFDDMMKCANYVYCKL